MNPISNLTGAVIHPVRTAGSVAGRTLGVATGGIRTAGRVIGWVAGQATGRPIPDDTSSGPVTPDAATLGMAPVETVPTIPSDMEAPTRKKSTAKRSAARKAGGIKAPSKKAAVVAPALGVPESEIMEHDSDATDTDQHAADPEPDTEPLIDPATAKAVASESEVLRKAADVHKG